MGLAPGSTIGIIGGGQLGRMLAMAANRLGFLTTVLDPAENAPAFQCSHGRLVGGFEDPEKLALLASQCDVVTYEFENVDVTAVEQLETRIPCYPPSHALATSQDRLIEKQFFNHLGIGTAPYRPVTGREDLEAALSDMGGKGILKTRRSGYDGKGQIRVKSGLPDSLGEAADLAKTSPCILEGFVSFKREISIISARAQDGRTSSFDIAENVHRDGILHTSTIPSGSNNAVIEQARAIAGKVLSALDYVGVLAIEFFETRDGGLLVNEFAPRVHNSGHWTEAACVISQFEQHIRAIAGLPLASAKRHSNCVMENLVGNEINRVDEILTRENTLLHIYGKDEIRDGRKMGHFTVTTPLRD